MILEFLFENLTRLRLTRAGPAAHLLFIVGPSWN